MTADDLRQRARDAGQEHLFAFWSQLTEDQRRELTADISRLDFELIKSLRQSHVVSSPADSPTGVIEPADALPVMVPDDAHQALYEDATRRGVELLAAGRVAALTVAGGQGTRLGFPGPKGLFPISPVRGKSLFQLFAESILSARRRYDCPIPWFIITSDATDSPTRRYFADHRHFALPAEDVHFCRQGVMPVFDHTGRVLLADKHRVALAPDGHGGSLRALASGGALVHMAQCGIDTISYFQVDNPLVHPVDPLILGLHESRQSEFSSLAVSKAQDNERVGLFVMLDGRLAVVEYSNFPHDWNARRNPDGTRRFDAANAAVHVIDRRLIERLTALESAVSLPWHRAEKLVPFVDPRTGLRVHPRRPNAVKLETFVFDALREAQRPLLLKVDRAEWFSPVKNAQGVDSPATARRDLSRRAARWMTLCGARIPHRPDGEPDGRFEVSPLLATNVEQLRRAGASLPIIHPGDRVYLE